MSNSSEPDSGRPYWSVEGLSLGARLALPAVPGLIAFGLAVGTTAASKGLGLFDALLMNVLVFAGASQMVAMEIWPERLTLATAAVLAVVAVSFTVLVYGVVALLVKIDDIGLYLSKTAALRSVRALGRSLVIAMPTVLKVISVVGTAAMLWVGGSIVVHSLHALHLSWPYELTTSITSAVTGEGASAAVSWLVTAFLDAVFGFLLGSILIPVVNVLLVPIGVLFPEK